MTKQNFRTAYSSQPRKPFEPSGESKTQQHHVELVKVQNLIKQYDRSGVLTHVAQGVAHYGDYSKVNEYQQYLDFVNAANSLFAELPSNIREKFGNDPGQFFEYATDPKNKGDMEEMGLFPKPQEISKEKPKSPESPPSGDNKSSDNEEKSE